MVQTEETDATNSETRKVYTFDTFTEFLEFVQRPPAPNHSGGASRDTHRPAIFHHYKSWPIMLRAAQCGDPEMLLQARAIRDRIFAQSQRDVPQNLYDRRDDGGLFFDPGLVAEGQPDVWLEPREAHNAPQKSVKVVFNVAVSCGANTATLLQRGGAVLALVQMLQLQGIPHEIWLVSAGHMGRARGGGETREIRVRIKELGAQGQDDQIAFCLTSPDVFRRLMFSAYEVLGFTGCGQSGNYSYPCKTTLQGEVVIQHQIGTGDVINMWVQEQFDHIVKGENIT